MPRICRPQSVERIEVVRGPQSALYGGGAIGGIVHVVTPHGGPARLNATVRRRRLRARCASAPSTRRLAAALDVGRDARPAAPPTATRAMRENRRPPCRQRRLRARCRDRSASAGPTAPSGASAWTSAPVTTNAAPRARTDRIRMACTAASISSRAAQTDTRGVRASAIFGAPAVVPALADVRADRCAERIPEPQLLRSVCGRHVDDRDAAGSPGAISWTSNAAARSLGRLGVPLRAGRQQLHQRRSTRSRFPSSAASSGWFVETRWPLRGRGALTAGRPPRAHPAHGARRQASSARPAFDDDVVWSANPKMSAAWFLRRRPDTRRLDEDARRRGHGHQAADGVRDWVHATIPSLKPERSRSVDVGVEQAFAGSTFVADADVLRQSLRRSHRHRRPVLQGASRYQTDNIANASAKGLELGVRWRSARWPRGPCRLDVARHRSARRGQRCRLPRRRRTRWAIR